MAEQCLEIRDHRDGFLWISNDVFDNCVSKLKPSSFAVYTALCRLANNGTQECFPSQTTIGKMVGLTDRAVRKALKELTGCGLVSWTNRDGRSNIYTLTPRNSESGTPVPTNKDPGTTVPVPRNTGSGHPGTPVPTNKTNEQDSLNKTRDKAAIKYVFDYFCTRIGKKQLFNEARANMLHARLKETMTMFDGDRAKATNFMADCIDTLAESPWHNGANPEGKKYLNFETLFGPQKYAMFVTRTLERLERKESEREEEWDD